MGRIIGVFGKDLDNFEDFVNRLAIDNQLPISLTVSNVVGAVLIITVLEHYFILVAIAISFGYQYFAAFYRASAREVKRLDSMLRSLLYSHLSESLTGNEPTIVTERISYGEIPRFVTDNQFYIDLENRALFLTVTNQRWLAIRLDFCGACLVFFVAIFAVVGVSGINAAQIGLVLTYTTSLTQLCGMLTRQTADVENYMNSVERVTHYSQSDLIEQEPPHEIPDHKPPSTWPENGTIIFENVCMRYRPGLPNVLHNISMSIHSGEKIGVVGRTGAGKSSLTLALLRMVEYNGLISIDGIDISKIGLRDLRTKVSIIPQDPIVFSGTIRTTLDPFSIYDDAKLWDALRRSYLIDTEPSEKLSISNDGNRKLQRKISLDTVIEPEGANLSVGEKSLLNLARALVRDTTVVILDEATASVDLETDKKIQQTIQTQFSGRTLICIALLDSGKIIEFDTPAKLFDMKSGIFRELCDRSSIKLEEIEKSAEHRERNSDYFIFFGAEAQSRANRGHVHMSSMIALKALWDESQDPQT
ncbi:P-loop containing nucleoside triphosphate hydrolase protein [Crucibulum laeve]|uniref:P-loop containing nucleoside triphosphate hydrolase protein n=1 Tax=Crucibulum laeve TaxID=68775 RepID=A0A5C3M642_9AGAR|nr:P-loop containing nucleoside triphosphate hydrolase protein [Crucibulum laeve]